MDKIFWGFLLLFIDFKLNLGSCTINLLPGWLGYLFLLQGATQMLPESELFEKVRPWCTGMMIYNGALWVMDILGTDIELIWVNVLLMLISVLGQLYVSYLFIRALMNVEQHREADLQCAYLDKVWRVVAGADVLSIVMLIIPVFAIISVLVAFVAGIFFLVAVHRTRKAYRELCGE